MKNLLFLLLASFNMISVFSQDLPAREIITPSNFIMNIEDDSNEYIEGSIFYNNHWNAKIVINTTIGKTYRVDKGNYNLRDNVFVIKTETDSIFKIQVDNISTIIFDKKQFEFLDKCYYERLSKGKVNLFKKYTLEVQEGRIDAISKIKMTEDKYVKTSKYFIKSENGFLEIKLSKKGIQNYFDDSKKKQLKKFVKKNSLKYKNDKDLKTILNYYNSL